MQQILQPRALRHAANKPWPLTLTSNYSTKHLQTTKLLLSSHNKVEITLTKNQTAKKTLLKLSALQHVAHRVLIYLTISNFNTCCTGYICIISLLWRRFYIRMSRSLILSLTPANRQCNAVITRHNRSWVYKVIYAYIEVFFVIFR